jgi:hypothetical protein
MWGASLFSITILLATSSGRSALEAYVGQTITRFAEQAPYSYLILAFAAALALVLQLMMRRRSSETPVVFRVRWELRGASAATAR